MKTPLKITTGHPKNYHPVSAKCERGSTPASSGRYPSSPGQVPQLFPFLRVQSTPKNPTVTVTVVTVTGNPVLGNAHLGWALPFNCSLNEIIFKTTNVSKPCTCDF